VTRRGQPSGPIDLAGDLAERLGWLDVLEGTGQARNPAVVRALAKLGAHFAAWSARADPQSRWHRDFH
jgi:hypothetical protein